MGSLASFLALPPAKRRLIVAAAGLLAGTQTLPARHGHASQPRLGVAGGSGRVFEAHAWLERDERVLIEGPVEGRHVPLPAVDARP